MTLTNSVADPESGMGVLDIVPPPPQKKKKKNHGFFMCSRLLVFFAGLVLCNNRAEKLKKEKIRRWVKVVA